MKTLNLCSINDDLDALSDDTWNAVQVEKGLAYFYIKHPWLDMRDSDFWDMQMMPQYQLCRQFIFKEQLYTIVSCLMNDGISVGFYATPF